MNHAGFQSLVEFWMFHKLYVFRISKPRVSDSTAKMAWIPQAKIFRRFPHGESEGKTDTLCSQISPCGHPAVTDSTIIRTAAKFPVKHHVGSVTTVNSLYCGHCREPLSVLSGCPQGESWLYRRLTEIHSR